MSAHPWARGCAYVTKTRQHRSEHTARSEPAAHAEPGPGGVPLARTGVRELRLRLPRALAAHLRPRALRGGREAALGPCSGSGLGGRNAALRGSALPRRVCRDAARMPAYLEHTRQRLHSCPRPEQRWRRPHGGAPRVSTRSGLFRAPCANVKAPPRSTPQPALAAAAARSGAAGRGRQEGPKEVGLDPGTRLRTHRRVG